MLPRTVACAFLVVIATGVAQDKKPGVKVDKARLAGHIKSVQSATKGMTKPMVEDAQQKLDAAKEEFTKWLADGGINRDDPQVKPVWTQVAKVQASIDKKRGRPRPRAEFAPFVGTWTGVGVKNDGTKYDVVLTIQDFGEVKCLAKWAHPNFQRTMTISLQYEGSGQCTTERVQNGKRSVEVAAGLIPLKVDTENRCLDSELSTFTLSEDGSTITAGLKTEKGGRKQDFRETHDLKRK